MILLVGTGYMAKEYFKVLKILNVKVLVVGNSEKGCKAFKKVNKIEAHPGGLNNFIKNHPEKISQVSKAIVAVPTGLLFESSKSLIKLNIANILVEKPGSFYTHQLEILRDLCSLHNSELFIAYNRRFFSSVLEVEKLLYQDQGISSFNFEITEWSHIIENLTKPKEDKDNWFIANTSHVVDLAFYLGGFPVDFKTFSNGSLKWHNSASSFSGAGISSKGACFSYNGNWEGPGRWGIELISKKHKYFLSPLEGIKIQKLGSIKTEEHVFNKKLDQSFKPGLYLQVESFLNSQTRRLCSINEQIRNFKFYKKIANY